VSLRRSSTVFLFGRGENYFVFIVNKICTNSQFHYHADVPYYCVLHEWDFRMDVQRLICPWIWPQPLSELPDGEWIWGVCLPV
jgi:hypothetical protein